MDLKPNEQVVKVGYGMLMDKSPLKIFLTNQKRIYLKGSNINDNTLEDFKEITYFNRSFLNKDGVHIITKEKEIKFIIKNRKNWEKFFSSLY